MTSMTKTPKSGFQRSSCFLTTMMIPQTAKTHVFAFVRSNTLSHETAFQLVVEKDMVSVW